MLQDWIKEMKTVPTKLKTVPTRAKRRAYTARVTGQANLWNAGTNALEAAETFFANAPDNIPVLSKVADAAERATQERLEAFTRVTLSDYNDMNAKDAIKAVGTLNHVELLRVKRLEEATKARKTVLAAITKGLEKTLVPPVVEPTTTEEAAAVA